VQVEREGVVGTTDGIYLVVFGNNLKRITIGLKGLNMGVGGFF
jgi:hypothetical protein